MPLAHGVDLSIQAATKYIGGHADVMLGYVTANESHAKDGSPHTHGDLGLYRQRRRLLPGACAGLRTLPVRLARHMETGLTLARWLKARPEVARVLHPALEGDPGHALWKRDFTGACGLFGVELKPVSHEARCRLDGRARAFRHGLVLGRVRKPDRAGPYRCARPSRSRPKGPVLRIHAGLEDPDDLIADLEAGFARMAKAAMSAETLSKRRISRRRRVQRRRAGAGDRAGCSKTGAVLMVAWMNRETLTETLEDRRGHLLVALAQAKCGARARPPAIRRSWSKPWSIATATRCC